MATPLLPVHAQSTCNTRRLWLHRSTSTTPSIITDLLWQWSGTHDIQWHHYFETIVFAHSWNSR